MKMMIVMALGFDSYNQQVTGEICQTLKSYRGGDDIPRVLVVYEENSDGNS